MQGKGYCQCGCGGLAPLAPYSHASRGYVRGEPLQYILGHHTRGKHPNLGGTPYTIEDRGHTTPCWIWKGFVYSNGYCTASAGTGNKQQGAHVVMYQRHVGPVPDGKILDHLCRVRNCVNPAHLEPVTYAVNSQRGANAKLTAEKVRQIRARLAEFSGYGCAPIIARDFGVSSATINDIKRGHTWKNVT